MKRNFVEQQNDSAPDTDQTEVIPQLMQLEGRVPFEPVTTDTGTTFTRPFGLMLTVEVGRPGVDTYGDLLNGIAAAWRGREELSVRPGQEGGIRNEDGAPVGLWLIGYA